MRLRIKLLTAVHIEVPGEHVELAARRPGYPAGSRSSGGQARGLIVMMMMIFMMMIIMMIYNGGAWHPASS